MKPVALGTFETPIRAMPSPLLPAPRRDSPRLMTYGLSTSYVEACNLYLKIEILVLILVSFDSF